METAANKIKKFFSQKNVDRSFKKAGPGRKLNDDASSSSGQNSKGKKKPTDVYVPVKRDDLTNEAKMARDAAIERLNIKQNASGPINFSIKSIKEQVKRELEQETKKNELEASVSNLNIAPENSACAKYSVDGVFFRCPLISDEILPKKEWKGKIKAFLYEQMSSDPGLTACLLIKNCNVIDKAEDCIETLKKYLTNIISNPTETKYQRIRMTNRIFCDKVANVEGSMEFLKAAGFKEITYNNEAFLEWSECPLEMLIQLCDALDLCEVIPLEIDRNIKVLLPSQAETVYLPPDFFRMSKEEILNEQKSK